MKTLIRFIFSKLFLKQFLIAVAISGFLFLAVVISLRIFTHHGQKLLVPDLVGYNEAQVSRIITESEFRYEIIDSVYTQDVLPGTVFDQIPAAGTFVKQDRKIYLILNAKNSEMVVMPSLKNVSLRQANATLDQVGLKVGKIVYVASEFKDLVLNQIVDDQIVAPGTRLPKWTEVTLQVGRGLGQSTTVIPYLRGMYWVDAKGLIASRSLNEGSVLQDTTINQDLGIDSALVWQQYPQPDVSAQVGKSVDIWLTMDTAVVYAADSTLIPLDTAFVNAVDTTLELNN